MKTTFNKSNPSELTNAVNAIVKAVKKEASKAGSKFSKKEQEKYAVQVRKMIESTNGVINEATVSLGGYLAIKKVA